MTQRNHGHGPAYELGQLSLVCHALPALSRGGQGSALSLIALFFSSLSPYHFCSSLSKAFLQSSQELHHDYARCLPDPAQKLRNALRQARNRSRVVPEEQALKSNGLQRPQRRLRLHSDLLTLRLILQQRRPLQCPLGVLDLRLTLARHLPKPATNSSTATPWPQPKHGTYLGTGHTSTRRPRSWHIMMASSVGASRSRLGCETTRSVNTS